MMRWMLLMCILHAVLWVIVVLTILVISRMLMRVMMLIGMMTSMMRMLHAHHRCRDHDGNDCAWWQTLWHRDRHPVNKHRVSRSEVVRHARLDGGVPAIVRWKRLLVMLIVMLLRVMMLMVGMIMIGRVVMHHGTATATWRRWRVGIPWVGVHGMRRWIMVERTTTTAIVQRLMIWHLMMVKRLVLLLHSIPSGMASRIHELRNGIGVFDSVCLRLFRASSFSRCFLCVNCRCYYHRFLHILSFNFRLALLFLPFLAIIGTLIAFYLILLRR
mmetsp:Transcript_43736/g.92974  ORF Transcript_43736/g.92974 Transcript_43736/m.92974 type:complete len:272 (+) Transcript_43736:838-1653(+)